MIWLLTTGIVTAAMAATVPTIASAQTTKPAIESAPAAVGNDSLQRSTGDDTSVQTEPTISAAVEVEIQRRVNELWRDVLADRAAYIDRWLIAITLIVAVGGYIGFRRFREIEKEAKASAEAAKASAEAAERYLEEIEKKRVKADEAARNIDAITRDVTANAIARDMTADDAPEKARQAAANVLENTEASPIDKTIAQAVSLQQQGKSDEAIEKWRAVAHIAEGSDDDLAAKAWFSVGYLFRDKSPKDSISAYDEAIRLGPDYPLAYIGRGAEKAMLGQHEAAIADFDEAIRLGPDYPLAYVNRGKAKDKLGQHEAAIADFDEAIRLEPDYPLAYIGRGLAKDALGLKDEARKDLETALELARKAGNADVVTAVEQLLRLLDDDTVLA